MTGYADALVLARELQDLDERGLSLSDYERTSYQAIIGLIEQYNTALTLQIEARAQAIELKEQLEAARTDLAEGWTIIWLEDAPYVGDGDRKLDAWAERMQAKYGFDDDSFPASGRCPELHPNSTRESQCERRVGHSGDHVATSYSGSVKVYPSKWETPNQEREPHDG